MAKNGFTMNLDSLFEKISEFDEKFEFALTKYCEAAAEGLAGYAKEHRKWKDRTGDARKRLSGKTYKIPKGRRIELSHGVWYGIWLELANEKKYAVIKPSIRRYGNDHIIPGFNNFFDKKM